MAGSARHSRGAAAAVLLLVLALAETAASARASSPSRTLSAAGDIRRLPGKLNLIRMPDSTAGTTVFISIDSIRVLEGDTGTTPATFTVQLSAPLMEGGSLDYTTEDRTAQGDSDYVPVSGTLEFNTSDVSYSIDVPVIGDTLVEGNERFALRLSNPSAGIVFTDSVGICTIVNDERARFVLSTAGLTRSLTGTVASAFGDANGDGLPDLPTDLWTGHGFVPMQSVLSQLDWGDHHGSAWCDYDRDGRPDLVVVPYSNSDENPVHMNLFHNMGNGVFVDVAPALGMDIVGHAETAVWGDFDGDGWPDLFVPFYAHVPPYHSFLWHNNHDGTFTQVQDSAGVALAGLPESLKPEGADAVDWDGNGTLDLYCASHLFLNDGAGHFVDVREKVGLPAMFDEGAKFVDVDNDGDFDLYLRGVDGPHLFRNDGGHFVDVTASAGFLGRLPFYSGDSWADVDSDGDLDLLYANPPDVADELWLNQGDGTFVSDPDFAAAGFHGGLSAWADLDRDGDMDAVLGEFTRFLLVNQLDALPKGSRTLRVWVLDADSMQVAFGATARLREIGGGPGTIQTRTVDGGSGYLTQSEYPLHFAGLGHARYSLEVRYPGPGGGTVVDGTVNAILAEIVPEDLPYPDLFVFRDGRVEFGAPGGHDVLAVPPDHPAPGMLAAPRPVPAHGPVTVPFVLSRAARADLSVHDMSGRRVRTLAGESTGEGFHTLTWDLQDEQGRRCPSGIYFVRLAVDGRLAAERRIVVLR